MRALYSSSRAAASILDAARGQRSDDVGMLERAHDVVLALQGLQLAVEQAHTLGSHTLAVVVEVVGQVGRAEGALAKLDVVLKWMIGQH